MARMDELKVDAVADAARQALDGDSTALLALPQNVWGLAAHVLTHLIARRVAAGVPCSVDTVTFWSTGQVCTFEHDDPDQVTPDVRTSAAMIALDATAVVSGAVADHDEWRALWASVPHERRHDLLTVLVARFTATPAMILKELAA